ncbi:aldose epimerase family protein [Bacillus sp. REN16]|uniref:aldose epimerase family protein n=1 Tax=Bacillus sp. REN16 TaxID=2887296 RepID=UPI001E393C9B|nr:aldose epimerase family protein [Bacillus sp. REN16]MCC3356966.1 galactose mutarotase [Bacillus sp. REN16]
MKVTADIFGELGNKPVHAYTIENNNGMSIRCINYGCIITDMITPDQNGDFENIVLGFDKIEDYLQYSPYFGAIVGPVAGRIKAGQFELDDTVYQLEKNENNNHLHGGAKGFSNLIWDANLIEQAEEAGVEFEYIRQDGEGGYPGTVTVKVRYILNNNNEFKITMSAVSDKNTILNLTNHTYFNLSGNAKRDILQHELTLKSNRFLELNDELLPTGKMLDVEGTAFDFQQGRKIVDGTTADHPQNILAGNGYDHPFLLTDNQNQEIQLSDETSGRTLIVETNQPAVVIYTSNQLNGQFEIRGSKARPYLGICLETQGLPDAIHHPHFPSVVVKKDEQYQWETKYTFLTK